MRILFIHTEKKLPFGAHFINDLIVKTLRQKGHVVDTIYPSESIEMFSKSLTGISNILFFYSLVHKKCDVKKYDIIQGTTYTVLPFIGNGSPVVSHFGSTTYGFLKKVPSQIKLKKEKEQLTEILAELKDTLNITQGGASIKALRDISQIEIEVARKSHLVIATSEKVKKELVRNKVNPHKIKVIHNAIEDFWFTSKPIKKVKPLAQLVYLGRMGDDLFTVKLKGITRLISILRTFPDIEKNVIGMCNKITQYEKILTAVPKTHTYLSVEKRRIPFILKTHYADIYINTGRYEGFCLSLIEAMSQGLIPIIFPIGVAPEIIKNGKNGFIVHNLNEMREKIDLLKENQAKRAKMAKEAMKTSLQFTPAKMTDELVKEYKKL